MKLMTSLLCLLFIVGNPTDCHEFHVSITQINHNKESRKLEIMLKLFTDDLSEGLDRYCGAKMHLGTPNEPPIANDRLKDYVMEHFSIATNLTPLEILFLGKQQEDDATWVYFESEKLRSVSSMTIKNSLLTDIFPDQINIVSLLVNDQKKSLTLSADHKQEVIDLVK